MKKSNFLKPSIIIFFIIAVIFFIKASLFLDPDFGWHIRLGEMEKFGEVFKSDPFSYTMPSFPFVDHEWLSNIFLAKIYQQVGYATMALVFTLIAGFLLLVIKRTNLSDGRRIKEFPGIDLLVIMLSAASLLPFFGIRPQVESWLMFSIILLIIFDQTFKYIFFIPVLTLLWVNLHGSFLLPVVSLGIIFLFKSLRERRLWLKGLVVLVITMAATLINPYGLRVWSEVIQQVSDTSVRSTLQEWRPFYYFFNIFLLFTICLSLSLFKKYLRLFKIEYLLLNLFFLVQATTSVRHVPLWILVNTPMLKAAIGDFYLSLKSVSFAEPRFTKLLHFTILGTFIFFVSDFLLNLIPSNKFINEHNFYPKEAAVYLRENSSGGQVFSEYGWGGYLIWKLPKIKVFIDGRMATWKWNGAPPEESNYVMGEYVGLMKNQIDYKKIFQKYNIDTVVWPTPAPLSLIDYFDLQISNRIMGKDISKFRFVDELKNSGWKEVHRDDVAIILKAPQI